MPDHDKLTNIEKKISELEPRIDTLEENYKRDVETILELLSKIEKKLTGAGLDNGHDVGIIVEIRDLKKENVAQKEEAKEFKRALGLIERKIEVFDRWKWFIGICLIGAGWILTHLPDLIQWVTK
ncbi:MAG: hypothetical protein AABY07_08060 [Nanoarchaeota archaeon]